MLPIGDVEGTSEHKRGEEGQRKALAAKEKGLARALQATHAVRQSERELTIRNQIADIFLVVPDEKMYGEVLQVILQAMESEHGFFGYIDEDGNMVAPSLTRGIWDKCQVPDKDIVFPREAWGGIWGRAMIEKRTLYSNELFHVPEGHIPVLRAMIVPIVHQGELIGVMTVGNKATDYDQRDIQLLESIAGYIAPVLNARLQRDRAEIERKRAEWVLGERVKELTCLYEVNRDMQEELPIDELCRRVIEHLVPAMQFPEITVPVIELEDRRFASERYSERLSHGLQAEIRVGGEARGQLWVYYAEEKPFLIPEEQNLVNGVAEALGLWLERKRAEEALRKAHDELEKRVAERTAEVVKANEELRLEIADRKRAEEELRLLLRLTQAIDRTPDFHSALEVVLGNVCETTGWNYGETWIPSDDGLALECAPAWRSNAPEKVAGFRQVTEEFRFQPNIGLPGRVWSSKQPEWLPDVSATPDAIFLRARVAAETGLKAGFGIPIIAGEDVLAVLAFFLFESREEDLHLVELVSAVAAQLGWAMRRKQAEEALQESEEKLRAQYKGIPVPTYTWQGVEDDFVLVDYNDAAVEITQGKIADLVGIKASEMYRDRPGILEELSRCVAEKVSIEREMSYRFRSTGESRHLAVKYAFAPPDLVLVHTEDITERKRAEEELQRSYDAQTVINSLLRLSLEDVPLEELLRRTLDLLLSVPWLAIESKGSIFLVEDEPEILAMKVQKELEEVLQEACARISFGRCLCGQAALTQEIQFVDRLDDRHEIRFEGMTPHGHYCVPILSAGRALGVINLYLREGHRRDQREEDFLTAVANTVASIVMRRQAEEALKTSEERYRSLFDGVPVGLYRTTSEGQILDVNPALVKMLAYPDRESLLAVNSASIYVAPDVRERWQALIDRDGVVRDAEVQVRRYDGVVIWVRDTARAIRNAEPPVVYYEGAVEDITERRQAQAALIEAEKMAIAGRLAASLAHEINNPLQTVIGCLGLAEETLAERGDASRYLQVAHEELRRTADIVAQLRDLHRPSRPEDREPTDVNALLDQVLDLSRKQCESQGIEVLRATADLPALPLVADQIKQVLLNLLLNAIEAMPQGGRLQVSTTYTSQPAGVRIAFTDSGGGIAPDVLLHVFEPFYSTRPEGLGLGLFISRNIVKQHGGQIEVDSREGEGATFTVWLPE